MASDARIDVSGLEALQGDLRAAGRDIRGDEDQVRPIVAEEVVDAAKRRAPVLSGDLRRSIGVEDGDAVATIRYAAWQHFVGQKGRAGFEYMYRAVDDAESDMEDEAAEWAEDKIDKRLRRSYG